MNEIIDTHCHLDHERFNLDLDKILAECQASGVVKIVVPAITSANWDTVLQLCQDHKMLYPALGLHPLFIEQHTDEDIALLDSYLQRTTVVAIGEIGLDYYVQDPDKDKQLFLFEHQLALAEQYELPVILHVRKAHAQVLSCLKKYHLCGGIAHAYNGSLEQAHEYIKLGFKLGIGGVLTYERATKLRRLATELPVESIVLETDAPDMAGALHHGERNSPAYLPETLSVLADLRGVDQQELAVQTCNNADDVFRGALSGSNRV